MLQQSRQLQLKRPSKLEWPLVWAPHAMRRVRSALTPPPMANVVCGGVLPQTCSQSRKMMIFNGLAKLRLPQVVQAKQLVLQVQVVQVAAVVLLLLQVLQTAAVAAAVVLLQAQVVAAVFLLACPGMAMPGTGCWSG